MQRARTAQTLLLRVKDESETIFVPDVVIAEVEFILSSKRHYQLSRSDVVDRLTPLLRLRQCRLTKKRIVPAALDQWVDSQKLSFVDALVVASAQEQNRQVATFDKEVRTSEIVSEWQE